MKAIHFGAGNIGRGFIGKVLHDNGYQVTFVDTDPLLVQRLTEAGSYQVEYLDDAHSRFTITGARALNGQTQKEAVVGELASIDLVTTSVGVANLKYLADTLKQGLLARSQEATHLYVLANENAINASDTLAQEIEALCTSVEWAEITSKTTFVNTAIDRLALAKEIDGINSPLVEPYFEWVIDGSAIKPGAELVMAGATFVDDMSPFIQRKLYIVNAEHAAYAYLGALYGYETVQEAIQDVDCQRLVTEFLTENKQYFIKTYGMADEELESFIKKTLRRHSNPLMQDDIHRVGRAPLRKLQVNDRLVAPVLALEKLGAKNDAGKKIIAVAYRYRDAGDPEAVQLEATIQELGIKQAIMEISQLPEPLAGEIATLYEEITAEVVLKKGVSQ